MKYSPDEFAARAATLDDPDRRPSHADRRSAIAREMLGKQFLATLPSTPNLRTFKSLIKDLISL